MAVAVALPNEDVDAVTEVKVAFAGSEPPPVPPGTVPTVQLPLETIITCPFVLPLATG